MNNRFFIGLVTDVQDGVFLVVGQEVGQHFTGVFLLPEEHLDDVHWGDVLKVDLRGPTLKVGEDLLPIAKFVEKKERTLRRNQAVTLQEAINAFLIEKGWTEETQDETLGEVMRTMQAHFSIFTP